MKPKLPLITMSLVTASALVVMTASAVGVLEVKWGTVDGGGGLSSAGGGYSLAGTIGQPDAGPCMYGGTYGLMGGFLAGSTGPGAGCWVSISGNAGIAGAVLSYNSGGPQTATADGSGNYDFTVPGGWSGTVTPALPHYFFSPASRSYVGLGGDQTGQDYVAYPYVRFEPVDGAHVCRTPYIVVKLMLSTLTRNASGAFNKPTVTFTLDGGSVLNLATIRGPLTAPQAWAHLVYKPTSALSLGPHTVVFTHPEVSGTISDTWSFTAENITCADITLLSAPADGQTLQDPGEAVQLQASPGTRSMPAGPSSSQQEPSADTQQTQSAVQGSTSDGVEQAEPLAESAQPQTEPGIAPTESLAPQRLPGTAPSQPERAPAVLTEAQGVLGLPHPGLYHLLLRAAR